MPGFAAFEREHLEGVLALCEQEGWGTLPADPERAARALTAPGVVTTVALEGHAVVGFAQMLSDGQVAAYLALLVVADGYRHRGIGRGLVEDCFRRSGAIRVDVLADTESDEFYHRFRHRSLPGFRLYPLVAAPDTNP